MAWYNFFTNKTRRRREVSARRQQAANQIVAAYQDAASADPASLRHFEEATRGSHASIYTQSLRNDLVDYARFEVANNPNLKGIVMTKTNDIVGRSPKIRFLPSVDKNTDTEKKVCNSLTKKMTGWMKSIHLGKKLRIACSSKITDGESFLVAMKNSMRDAMDLQLDFRVLDCERVYSDPDKEGRLTPNYHEGITYDAFGDPVSYDISKDHPNGDDQYRAVNIQKGNTHKTVQSRFVFHWFRDDRSEQRRGVSELASALPIATILRRVRKAVALNNEIAASISILLETDFDGDEVVDSNGNTVDSTAYTGFEKVDYEAGTSMVLPDGVRAKQLESKTPNSSYLEFHNAGVNDIGRAIGMAFNKASGRSSDYNYSSGRLDHLADDFGNSVTREDLIEDFLDPKVLELWVAHALSTDGYLDPMEREFLQRYANARSLPDHIWSFDVFEDIDREKEAKGKMLECKLGANNRGHLLLQSGWDIDSHDQQAAQSYGFDSVEEYRQAVAKATFEIQDTQPNQGEEPDAKQTPAAKES